MQTPALSNVFKVARWEFVKHIKSPTFMVLTFLLPLLIGVVVGVSFLVERIYQPEEVELAVADRAGFIFPYLEEHSMGIPVTLSSIRGDPEQFAGLLQEGIYDGILLVEKESLATGSLLLYVEDARSLDMLILREVLSSALQEATTGAVSSYRLESLGVGLREIEEATAAVEINTRPLPGAEPGIITFLAPLAAGMALIFAVIFSGQMLLYGVLKEKRNRLVEILLSSISSTELLLGKIAGFGALTLTQVVIWLGAGLLIALSVLDVPELAFSAGQLLLPLLFFVFGYLMFSSIFAALGATMKEAEGGSQVQGLLLIILMVPLFLLTPLLMDPNATWARLLSYIPPFTPTTVLLRMGITTLPPWEIASTFAVLLLSTALFVYLGARIFEGTILQYNRAAGWQDVRSLFSKK